MDDHDSPVSLDADGELNELIKARKWGVVVGICEEKSRKGEPNDYAQASG